MGNLWTAMQALSFDKMRTEVSNIIAEGYPLGALLAQLLDDVINRPALSDLSKAKICEKIAIADQCLADGSSEALQLLDVAAFIQRQLNNRKSQVDTSVASH